MPATIARMKKAGVKKVAILESDDASGTAYTDAFKSAADKAGLNIVTTVTSPPGALDLGSQAAQLKSTGADAVYIASAVPTDVANAAKAMKEVQYEPYVFGNAAAAVAVVVEAVGPSGPRSGPPADTAPARPGPTPRRRT